MLNEFKKRLKILYLNNTLFKQQPLLLLTPPKSGSMALKRGLEGGVTEREGITRNTKINVIFIHSIQEQFVVNTINQAKGLRRIQYERWMPYILNKKGPLKIVLSIREPISQLISFFYYFGMRNNLGPLMSIEGLKENRRFQSIIDYDNAQIIHHNLINQNLKPCVINFFQDLNSMLQLDYIETELNFIGIDNPYDKMHKINDSAWKIKEGLYEILILKNNKGFDSKLLSDFVGRKISIPKEVNTIKDENYQKFKQLVMEELPNQKEWLQKWQNHPFMEKFYPDKKFI